MDKIMKNMLCPLKVNGTPKMESALKKKGILIMAGKNRTYIPFKASSFGCLCMLASADLKFSIDKAPELKSIWQTA